MQPDCLKGRVVCGTVYGEMHLKDLLGSSARVGYCIQFPDFYLVLHGPRCWKSTIMDYSINHYCQIAKEAESAVYHKQLFEELRELTPHPTDATHSTAIAAVQASVYCHAAAIVVITSTGRCVHLQQGSRSHRNQGKVMSQGNSWKTVKVRQKLYWFGKCLRKRIDVE